MAQISASLVGAPLAAVALGYLLLALAAALFVVAIALLALYRHRRLTAVWAAREEARARVPDVAATRLDSVTSLSGALARAEDAEAVADLLLDEVVAFLDVEFAGVAAVSEDRGEATGLAVRATGADVSWWRTVRFDLEHEPSGIASAAFEGVPIVMYDVQSSPRVNRAVAERVGAKSAAFIPVISGARVLAVLAVATTTAPRVFRPEEIATLEALAGEAALALERTRSAAEL
ncbi:MAG: GAF domain-containing protein, partial [Actinomycetota bacterium]|nr:GAF domain-containing protein [Actinomycetota bacterium]